MTVYCWVSLSIFLLSVPGCRVSGVGCWLLIVRIRYHSFFCCRCPALLAPAQVTPFQISHKHPSNKHCSSIPTTHCPPTLCQTSGPSFRPPLNALSSTPKPTYVNPHPLHCKKSLAVFLSPARMSLIKFSLAGNNLIIPAQGEFGY